MSEAEDKTKIKVTYKGARSRKIREFFCSNEECEVSEARVLWEHLIYDDERGDEVCPVCEAQASEHLGTSHGWVCSKERTKEQLKKRSKDHMAWCKKKGIHPNDTGYSPGNREWVNKTRAKNRSHSTISHFASAHKTWHPGKTPY